MHVADSRRGNGGRTAQLQCCAITITALLISACVAPHYAGPEAGATAQIELIPEFGTGNSAGDLEVLIYKDAEGCVGAMLLKKWNQGYFSKESTTVSAEIPGNGNVALEINWSGSGVAAGTGNYLVTSRQIIEFEPSGLSTYNLTVRVDNDRTGLRLSRIEDGIEHAVPVRVLKTTHGGSVWRGGRMCDGNEVLREIN